MIPYSAEEADIAGRTDRGQEREMSLEPLILLIIATAWPPGASTSASESMSDCWARRENSLKPARICSPYPVSDGLRRRARALPVELGEANPDQKRLELVHSSCALRK
jgi:hypothetical protein